MLRVIEERSQIKKAQKQFEKAMRPCSERNGTITIGGKGFHGPRRVSWSERLGIWWTTYSLNNRYENAFGVQEPRWRTRYGHPIPCVIDIPFKEINRRIGGAFAADEDNKIYLMHRGRIGGGRSGIGKTLFVENYRGKWETVEDGDAVSKLVLIAEFNNERFPDQIAHFVHEVQRIKGEAGKPKPDAELSDTFKEEFTGKKKYSVGKIEAECDHGLVVGKLAEKLESMGFAAGNSYPLDLYVLNTNGQIIVLFEVKTDSTSTSCYEAVGQLLFYSAKLAKKPQLVAVFPESLARQCIDVFGKIGLQTLTYRWVKNKPSFDGDEIAQLTRK